jgi:hypothetical protein
MTGLAELYEAMLRTGERVDVDVGEGVGHGRNSTTGL